MARFTDVNPLADTYLSCMSYDKALIYDIAREKMITFGYELAKPLKMDSKKQFFVGYTWWRKGENKIVFWHNKVPLLSLAEAKKYFKRP